MFPHCYLPSSHNITGILKLVNKVSTYKLLISQTCINNVINIHTKCYRSEGDKNEKFMLMEVMRESVLDQIEFDNGMAGK